MITIKNVIKNMDKIDEITFAEISDSLWDIGKLSEIKKKVSNELFTLHIGINMIGNWEGEGWWGIICEQAELVPFIPDTLKSLGLDTLKNAFENVITIFPDFTVFSNEEDTYCDIVNFLQNVRFKVSDERLKRISNEKRIEMVDSIHDRINVLEEMTDPLWGYDAEHNGWNRLEDYIHENI